ncbi:hypothetical protein C8P68_104335 [Mucilaginibacter yixingensis]|uniref:Uncharacterized protein n=2 Tax=Mucilaginibacter yixingensis TaxID=1295612 RepID=A0A2T5J9U4_9SPHI|nr:hypothetical protein C8P68_104335 [Mucilaginibacter yixingensis]
MAEWTPISLNELLDQIQKSELDLNGERLNFWQLIKITPIKWEESTMGDCGSGFWVVGICGTKVIWYNDIEEGFNISNYQIYGKIEEYHCNQDELSWAVNRLFKLVEFYGEIGGQLGPPKELS